LHEIAEKELADRPLSLEDYETILNIGKTLEEIAKFFHRPTSGPHPIDDDAMPVIADVHTDANSNTVLEEGVGYPYCVYAICSVEGQLVLTRGAGFSYYEFIWPSTDRLTDEAWRQMLQSTTPPSPPKWSASFLAEANWLNQQPDFYYWKTESLLMLWTSVQPDTVPLGQPVQAEISYYGNLADLTVWAESAAGQQVFADSMTRVSPGKFKAWISTTGLSKGRAWVVAQAPAMPNFSGDSKMVYRAGFFVTPSSAVSGPVVGKLPRSFALLPPWPNPFHANMTVAFDVPRASAIEIDIFEVSGRRVRTLVTGIFPAGRHRLSWDGADDAGRVQASGVYLLRLKVGTQIAMRKIILVK
jgi:hypothetical protein